MATYTASILIGHSHPNHSGIIPTHELFLSENSRPAWILVPHMPTEEFRKKIWIPSVENMLEDALLMINAIVLGNKKIRSSLNQFCKRISAVEIYSVPDIERRKIYKLSRKEYEGINIKLCLSVYEQSTLKKQLIVLKEYPFEMEVCRTSFSRSHSMWTGKTLRKGIL
jgi:hypothetical protein